MYEGIFNDFDIIKRHNRNNGNIKFEESAVFELLENLAPQHGPAQAVQIILEMLDAQTVRDCNIVKTDNIENIPTDDSNDSIVEVKVPEKCHPIIDLTDDSLQINESTVIAKTVNSSSRIHLSEIDSDSHEENYYGDQSDESRGSGVMGFDGYWNSSRFNIDPNSSEDILAMFEESNQSNPFESINQPNANAPEVSEMLEENNNDPNNNLDGTIFEEDLVDINNGNNNTDKLHLEPDNSSDITKVIDPAPGCSKDGIDIDKKLNYRISNTQSLPDALVKQPQSPIAGCSKDFDNSNSFEMHAKNVETVVDDALCIQNLLPWADWETIHTILEKYRDSPNRKQLALWDLVSEASDKASSDNKRKQDSNICPISKKSMKMEVDAFDDSIDILDIAANSTIHFDSGTYNESNDSISYGELSNELNKNNQNSNVSVASESSSALHFYRGDNKTKLIDTSSPLVNNESRQSQLSKASVVRTYALPKVKFNNQNLTSAALNQPNDFPNRFLNVTSVKKERVETVVSGSLNEHSTIQNDEKKSKETNNTTTDNLLNNRDNLSTFAVGKIVSKQEINVLNQLLSYAEKETATPRGEKINLIKPAKLNIKHKPLPLYDNVRVIERAPYIRPATFTFEKRNNDIHTISKNKMVCKTQDELGSKNQIQNVVLPAASDLLDDISYLDQPSSSNTKKNRTHDDFVHGRGMLTSMAVQNLEPIQVVTAAPNIVRTPVEALTVAGPSGNNNPVAETLKTENYDRTIYNKLRSMFPDIKSSYIKKICKYPPVLIDMNDKSQAISILIDHLLKEGHNHTEPVNAGIFEAQAPTLLSIDEQYEYLLGIFPDADPTFLRKFVEENINKENVIEQFIQEKLEKHDYPTKKQYLAKIKITEQIKTYTTDFKVEKFLEMFPDPFKHFEDEKRICVHQPIALEFLKSHFCKNKVNTICRLFATNKYNLSLTAKALTNLGYDMKSKRLSSEMPTENIPLLQEMTFVKHKQSIISYISSRKAAEEQLFKELQEKNLLLTCQCCFNEECMPTKCVECNNNHIFCYDCLIRGTEIALANGDANVKCFTDCQSDFSLVTLQKVLSPTTFSALLKKRQAAEIMAAEVEGLVSCPFCHFASIPPPEDKVFKCLNPECMKETCRQCKDLNHVPLRCDEVVKTDKARLLIEEKMTEALLRTCYKCKRQFYKEDGCNRMTCTCGATMCYVCNKPVNNYNHFNAQGGVNANLCPLWCDDKRLNAEAVIQAAENFQKTIMKQNPNLHIDTKPLLPKLPPRSRGPHDDIPNANQLPEHIRRIIGAGP